MHLDWWLLSRIKKPYSGEKETLEANWTSRPNQILDDLQGESIKAS